MRPDRIVVGECRGGEALDMLQAMNTGHDGSLTTFHANTPRDAISRLETMVMMAGLELPMRAIREQISSAVDVVVHTSRMRDGTPQCRHQRGRRHGGRRRHDAGARALPPARRRPVKASVIGEFAYTGVQPSCLKRFEEYGVRMTPRLNELALLHSIW